MTGFPPSPVAWAELLLSEADGEKTESPFNQVRGDAVAGTELPASL